MDRLKPLDTLVITQKKELGEIFTGFEQKNKYVVSDTSGTLLFYAVETGGSFFGRTFLKAMRPFEIKVISSEGIETLSISRPFKFLFHECVITDNTGKQLGSIKWEFSILTRKYSVRNPQGMEIYKLNGPLLKPWTFEY